MPKAPLPARQPLALAPALGRRAARQAAGERGRGEWRVRQRLDEYHATEILTGFTPRA